MSSQLATIADAIVSELTTLNASLSGTSHLDSIVRAYLHDFGPNATDDVPEDTTFRASVTTITRTSNQETRDLNRAEIGIPITLSKRVENASNATIDPLILTAETIMDRYADGHKLTGQGNIASLGVATAEPIYDPMLLDTQRMFVAVIMVTISAWY